MDLYKVTKMLITNSYHIQIFFIYFYFFGELFWGFKVFYTRNDQINLEVNFFYLIFALPILRK